MWQSKIWKKKKKKKQGLGEDEEVSRAEVSDPPALPPQSCWRKPQNSERLVIFLLPLHPHFSCNLHSLHQKHLPLHLLDPYRAPPLPQTPAVPSHQRHTHAQQQAQTQPCNHTDTHSINWSVGGVSAERQTADMSCAALDIINLTNMHRRNNYANPVLEHSRLIASSVWSRTLAFAFCCTRNAKNLYFSTCFKIYTIINH